MPRWPYTLQAVWVSSNTLPTDAMRTPCEGQVPAAQVTGAAAGEEADYRAAYIAMKQHMSVKLTHEQEHKEFLRVWARGMGGPGQARD